MNEKVLERIHAIGNHFDMLNREQKAIEELSELLNAVTHRDKLNTLEEFCDVIVTMIQLLDKYNLKLEALERFIEYKVSRTEARLNVLNTDNW